MARPFLSCDISLQQNLRRCGQAWRNSASVLQSSRTTPCKKRRVSMHLPRLLHCPNTSEKKLETAPGSGQGADPGCVGPLAALRGRQESVCCCRLLETESPVSSLLDYQFFGIRNFLESIVVLQCSLLQPFQPRMEVASSLILFCSLDSSNRGQSIQAHGYAQHSELFGRFRQRQQSGRDANVQLAAESRTVLAWAQVEI